MCVGEGLLDRQNAQNARWSESTCDQIPCQPGLAGKASRLAKAECWDSLVRERTMTAIFDSVGQPLIRLGVNAAHRPPG